MGRCKPQRKGSATPKCKSIPEVFDIEGLAAQHDTSRWFEEGSVVTVDLTGLEDTVRCPICYGKIKDSRVSMVCGHRYCAQCIDHCLRLEVEGRPKDIRECPVCRAHMPSRRTAREDAQFDALMQALYGSVAEYEAQEEQLLEARRQEQSPKLAADMKRMSEALERQKSALAMARATSCKNHKRPRADGDGEDKAAGPRRRSKSKGDVVDASGHGPHTKGPPGSTGSTGQLQRKGRPGRPASTDVAAPGARRTTARGRSAAPAAAAQPSRKARGPAASAARPAAQPLKGRGRAAARPTGKARGRAGSAALLAHRAAGQ